MEKKEIVAESPVTIAGVTLVPVAEITSNHVEVRSGMIFFGNKKPVYLMVVSPSEKRAFRITGEEMPLAQLLKEVPSLRDIVEQL
jgi:hypothetical protein